jgi:hypothetical protein
MMEFCKAKARGAKGVILKEEKGAILNIDNCLRKKKGPF